MQEMVPKYVEQMMNAQAAELFRQAGVFLNVLAGIYGVGLALILILYALMFVKERAADGQRKEKRQ